MTPLFDVHAHYTDSKFGDPKPLLESLFNEGICGILCAGTDEKSSAECIGLAEKYEMMYAAVGIHPEDISSVSDMQTSLCVIKSLCKSAKVKAIGEIGLDYYWDTSQKAFQKDLFDAQLSLAEELSLPVVIHDRDAHGDTFDIVSAHRNVTGIMHSYAGSAEMAKEYVKRGYYISFSGTLTFKNAQKAPEVLLSIPKERILTETDCPYLAPVPMRGKLNHSGYMRYTAEKAASLLGMEPDDFCRMEAENAKRILKIR